VVCEVPQPSVVLVLHPILVPCLHRLGLPHPHHHLVHVVDSRQFGLQVVHERALSLAEGQRIHYNFVKPHQALEGQTPAERAGVGIQGENKWLNLLKNTVRREANQSN